MSLSPSSVAATNGKPPVSPEGSPSSVAAAATSSEESGVISAPAATNMPLPETDSPPPRQETVATATAAAAAASPFTQKTLDSLRIEISRAEAEDDEGMARELQQQYDDLLRSTAAAASAVAAASTAATTAESTTTTTTTTTTVTAGDETPAALGAANGAAHAGEEEHFVLDKADEHINEVSKGRLFIGDITAAVDGKRLSAAGVTHVVDLANTICGQNRPERNVNYVIPRESGDWQDTCPSVVAKLVVKVDDVDEAPLDEHFDAINTFIQSAIAEGGVAFVHCFRGKSRSATSVIQFLMQVDGFTLREALKTAQEARPCIQLNVGFRKMLMELERRLRPDEPPSIKLKLTSRKPVLSSSTRRPSKSKAVMAAAATTKAATAAGATANAAVPSTTAER